MKECAQPCLVAESRALALLAVPRRGAQHSHELVSAFLFTWGNAFTHTPALGKLAGVIQDSES